MHGETFQRHVKNFEIGHIKFYFLFYIFLFCAFFFNFTKHIISFVMKFIIKEKAKLKQVTAKIY